MNLRYGARRSWRPPPIGRLTVYRPAGVFPRCPWKNFLVLRPVKMRECSGDLKQQHTSLTKHIDLAQRLITTTRPQKPKHSMYIKVEERLLNWLSYSAGTQTSGTRLQATKEATRRLIHSSSATSAKNYKFILLSVTIKWLKRSTCMPYIWEVSDFKISTKSNAIFREFVVSQPTITDINISRFSPGLVSNAPREKRKSAKNWLPSATNCVSVYLVFFLGAFAKFRKATTSFVMYVCPPARME